MPPPVDHLRIKAFIFTQNDGHQSIIATMETAINAFLATLPAKDIGNISITTCSVPYGSDNCDAANLQKPWWYVVLVSYVP